MRMYRHMQTSSTVVDILSRPRVFQHHSAAHAKAWRGAACRRWRPRHDRVTHAAAAGSEGEPAEEGADDSPPTVKEDWRAFRSRLLAVSTEEASDSSRQTPENMAVLREQNPYLADEGIWARETDKLAAGALLLAMPEAPLLSGDGRVGELVVLLLRHDPETGSAGVMLNRPCFASVGDLLGWGWSSGAPSVPLFQAFAESTVYLGGMFAPNKVARQTAMMLHGQADLQGSSEIVPGIYCGGKQAAAVRVLQGAASPPEYRFFSGSLSWQPKQLEREIEGGIWRTVECSRSVVLKQCWQLPVPLWREVHRLLNITVE